jgi:DnaK suppressor protein
MERAELEQFERILRGLLEVAEQPLRWREEIAVENAPDTIDRVQRAAEREMAIRQIESESSRLQSLKFSLEQIEQGLYGICQRCDEEIGLKRLKAVPWAAYCIKCQDIADREKRETGGDELPELRVREVA